MTLKSVCPTSTVNTALKENVKLSEERDELAATMKNLRLEFTKARRLKTENLGRELTNARFSMFREELAAILKMLGRDFPKEPGTCEESVPKAAYPVKDDDDIYNSSSSTQ